jgi:hypothetical protein
MQCECSSERGENECKKKKKNPETQQVSEDAKTDGCNH